MNSACEINMNHQLLKVITEVCGAHHPNTEPCFTIADFDFDLMFQRQNFLKPECPALKLYNSVFGGLYLGQHLLLKEKRQAEREELNGESLLEVWKASYPSQTRIDKSYIEICAKNLLHLKRNGFIHPLLCFKLNLEKHLNFACGVLQSLQYLKDICNFLPGLLARILVSLNDLEEGYKRTYFSNSARVNQLHLSYREAINEAESLARMNDIMAEFLSTTSRLQRILWMGGTDATLITAYNDFQTQQNELCKITPFCDYKYVVETLKTLLETITEVLNEAQRGGDIQISEDDLETPRD